MVNNDRLRKTSKTKNKRGLFVCFYVILYFSRKLKEAQGKEWDDADEIEGWRWKWSSILMKERLILEHQDLNVNEMINVLMGNEMQHHKASVWI